MRSSQRLSWMQFWSQHAADDWDFADEFIQVPQYDGRPIGYVQGNRQSLRQTSLKAISPPSWSWASQQRSGNSVFFGHYRRYIRDAHLGIKVLDVTFVNPPVSQRLQQESPTIALQVRAFVKQAVVMMSAQDSKATGRFTLTTKDDRGEVRAVADLLPDSAEDISHGDTVLCILCAVARAQYDRTLKTPTMYTGIAATPASDGSNFYRRIGLVIILDNEWFANVDKESQVELTLI